MSIIYPRSPREEMAGWIYLPRLVDKIRLHLAGKLHSDYHDNFIKRGFDQMWLEAARISGDKFIEVVKSTITDGEVCDWVRANINCSQEEKDRFRAKVLSHGQVGEDIRERLAQRKRESGLEDAEDIDSFVEFIDADEGRK